MSTASSDSSMDFGLAPFSAGDAGNGSAAADGVVWLDGDVLACSCPECGAPMSIRLWLMVADCFRCGTSIELSEEQEQEALRLLRRQEELKAAESRQAAAAITPTMLPKPRPAVKQPEPEITSTPPTPLRPTPQAKPSPTASPSTDTPPADTSRQRRRRVAASQVHRGARARVHEIYEKGGISVFLAGLLRDLPAWLVSLIVHLIAILLLGLWVDQPANDSQVITLSTSVSYDDFEGRQSQIDTPDAFEFDDPGATAIDGVVEQPGAPTKDEVPLDPIDAPVEIPEPVGDLPPVAQRPINDMPTMPLGRMFAGRDPKVRTQTALRSGGTSATEAAVARALEFFARHQSPDGSWSLDHFNRTPDCDETCRGRGVHSDTAGTALCLLPFLGAGQTHLEGKYQHQVTLGLKWLVEHQEENGDLRGRGDGRMYAHGQATIALCEAYALTGDEQLREPAQLALNFIVRAQHSEGGWRYTPGERGDTSVVGWQLMALKSGQMAYLYVPARTFQRALHFLDQVQADKIGGRYSYQPRGAPSPAMTAEGLLCHQYLGWPKDEPGLDNGIRYLLKDHLPKARSPNIYLWYYATQVLHHMGGQRWKKWNTAMRDVLVKMQRTTGHAAGSWDPKGSGNSGGFAERGGRLYMTSLATCILEVYYRYMPLYSSDALEGFQ